MARTGIAGVLRATWHGLVLGGLVLLAVIAWVAVRSNRRLAAANAVLSRARAYPYPLTALRLETPDTQVVDEGGPMPDTTNVRYLVLVSSGSCATCAFNRANWVGLLRSLRPADHVSVWIIDYGATPKASPLVKELAVRRIPYRVLQVTNQTLFTLKTGLIALPTTMLLDGGMRPRLVDAGVLTGEALKAFERATEGDPGSAADPFLPAGTTGTTPAPNPSSKTGAGSAPGLPPSKRAAVIPKRNSGRGAVGMPSVLYRHHR